MLQVNYFSKIVNFLHNLLFFIKKEVAAPICNNLSMDEYIARPTLQAVYHYIRPWANRAYYTAKPSNDHKHLPT